ncbi:MAG: HAD-IA family hydrolase [Bowdeniella nasicola]|nr:HAD-IA family hydrolase [Bowdeniella nasicola]
MRHVIWDMGGTLIDTYPDVNDTLTRAVGGDAETAREVAKLTQVSIAHAMTTLAKRTGVDRSALEAAYRQLKQRWHTHPAPVMTGARALIAAVRQAGYHNIVVTHRDRASATTLLRAHRLDIDAMICASDGYPRKPDPAMFILALHHCEIPAAATVAIGDRPIDISAARAAGIDNFFLCGTHANARLVTKELTTPAPNGARTYQVSELAAVLRALRTAPFAF